MCSKDVAQSVHVQDSQGNFYCEDCWNANQKSNSQKVIVRIRRGAASQQVVIPGQSVSIGSGEENDLILPLAWVRAKHLIVRHDAGVTRASTIDSQAQAFIGSEAITTAGAMLPPAGSITIPAPVGLPITLKFFFDGADKGAVLIDEADTFNTVPPGGEIAGVSPLDESPSVFAANLETPAPPKAKKRPLPRQAIGLIGFGVVLAIVIAALLWNDVRRSLYRATVAQDYTQVVQNIAQAKNLIDKGQYVEAKAQIDEATRVAGNRPSFTDQILILKEMSGRPEIKFGGLGYIKMERQWLPPETAAAWQAARAQDDPQIQTYFAQAKSAFAANKDLESAQRECDQALALMAAEPVHPHPMQKEFTALRDTIHDRLVAVAMTAKGLVLFDKRWVTPAERFRLQQIAKGLAEYKGVWLTKDAAFAAEQKDKGLVLYQGHWMTPDAAEVARGYVKYEGAWMTPAQREQRINDRPHAVKNQAEQQAAAEQKAEQKQKDKDAIEAKYPDAYQMSQEFVKDILKTPGSAQFQPFNSPKVKVSYADGWYTVAGVVDAQNSFGVALRSRYICKLKPVGANHWQADNTYLVDN
jgi:hypothetical protein